jgi:hypothetical protein
VRALFAAAAPHTERGIPLDGRYGIRRAGPSRAR